MCGICGFNWGDEALIARMTKKIHHRGPDASGTKSFENMSLGNTRLSIIDLSVNGNQPMFSDDGRFCIVYNGEVYNFLEIREQLVRKGYVFKSKTDTETVLKSYQEYGADCLHKFNGMYSIAIWDNLEKELFIARDRIGIKPLYYYLNNGKFVFASEIKCILEAECVSKDVNLQSMYHYLGYEFVPAPETMFKNIHKLPQGHYAIYKNNKLDIRKYWELQFKPHKMNEEEISDKLYTLLETSVKRRLLCDVPLGVFLSGGLDSSTLVGYVSKLYPSKVKTFSIGYKDASFSELPYAKQVSDFFHTEHNVLMIDPVSPNDIEDTLYHLDEPMTDLSTIPFRLICKKAREQVKVCLSGEGGDEVLLGYDRFKAAKLNSYYNFIPSVVREKFLNKLIMSLPDQPQKKGAINMLKRFIEGSMYPKAVGAMRWQYFMNNDIESNIFRKDILSSIKKNAFEPIYNFKKICNSTDSVEQDIFVDIKLTMADSVLMKVDKMSMANALEVRVPFLDYEVVEFCAGIPSDMKLKGFNTKHILRKTLKKHNFLPDNIIYRGKQGYSLPVKNWLREDMKDFMISLLSTSPIIKETLNTHYVEVLINEHLKRTHNHNHILWCLINLALWYKRFWGK